MKYTMEYEKCMTGMKSNLKETLQIANTESDPRIKLQARAIVSDCYKLVLDMSTNAGIVSNHHHEVCHRTERTFSIITKVRWYGR